jgi:energy-coupling factor transporter ATP-binding protein EcfA2
VDRLIDLDNVSFSYSLAEKKSLRSLNISIMKGEFIGIVGPRGAGKTTLCLCLDGIIPNLTLGKLEGTVTVKNLDTRKTPVRELAKIVGVVFDNPEYQLSQTSVEEEVAFGMENLGVPRDEMQLRVREMLELVGLAGLEKRSPFELSGGQQQRLAIAAAMAMLPEILVLDEPTSNLDPIGKDGVYWVARKLKKERGMTIILADHEVEMMTLCADRIFVMNEGEVMLQGAPSEVFQEVDTLEKIGLRVPQVAELAHRLRAQHNKWSELFPVTLEEAESLIKQRISES